MTPTCGSRWSRSSGQPRAREVALRTETRLVIERYGKWVRASPAKLAQQ